MFIIPMPSQLHAAQSDRQPWVRISDCSEIWQWKPTMNLNYERYIHKSPPLMISPPRPRQLMPYLVTGKNCDFFGFSPPSLWRYLLSSSWMVSSIYLSFLQVRLRFYYVPPPRCCLLAWSMFHYLLMGDDTSKRKVASQDTDLITDFLATRKVNFFTPREVFLTKGEACKDWIVT